MIVMKKKKKKKKKKKRKKKNIIIYNINLHIYLVTQKIKILNTI